MTKPNPDALAALQAGGLSKAPRDEIGAPRRNSADKPKSATADRTRIQLYFDSPDANRVRGAYRGSGEALDMSLSNWLIGLVMDGVRKLEHERNDGHPWAGVDTGTLRPGPKAQ